MIIAVLALSIVLVATVPVAADEATPTTRPIPTLWLVGDSTVRNGTKGQQGWGDPLRDFFDPAKVTVENRARGGRSSRTFITEGLWQKVLDDARPGDFVLIQLGHNDGGPLAGDDRERGTIRGIGDETEQVTLRNGEKQTVHTYGWYLRRYVRDARAKGLTPILCSPVPRCPRPGTTFDPDAKPDGYRLWVQQVAEQEKVPYIDLHRLISRRYVGLTPEQIKSEYFCEADFTHTSPAGARLNASVVAEGIRQLKDLPLSAYLREPSP
jgi:lysophospholipase L1-like esterase